MFWVSFCVYQKLQYQLHYLIQNEKKSINSLNKYLQQIVKTKKHMVQ